MGSKCGEKEAKEEIGDKNYPQVVFTKISQIPNSTWIFQMSRL